MPSTSDRVVFETSEPSETNRADLAGQRRAVGNKRSLPGSRTVIGALLISVSVVGTFAVATGVTGADETTRVVVAARNLDAGTLLRSSDVRSIEVDVDDAVVVHALNDVDETVGRALLGPVGAGELIQKSSVTARSASGGRPEMSFSLPAARALGGEIRSGETIDLLVTEKTEGSIRTTTAVRGARVLRTDRSGDGFSRSGDVTIVVAVTDGNEAATIARSLAAGEVTLVRTTGTV